MTPKVSVIIPLYNKENYILDCLRSLENQDFSDWECLIVDDGSVDASMKIVESFIASSEKSWRILTKSNGGFICAQSRDPRSKGGIYCSS